MGVCVAALFAGDYPTYRAAWGSWSMERGRPLQRIHRCRHVLAGDVAPLPQRFGSCRETLLRQRSLENVSALGFSEPAVGGRPAFERADYLVADIPHPRHDLRLRYCRLQSAAVEGWPDYGAAPRQPLLVV